jgi:hypothetical protein
VLGLDLAWVLHLLQVAEALALYPEHTDSLELKKLLKVQLNAL